MCSIENCVFLSENRFLGYIMVGHGRNCKWKTLTLIFGTSNYWHLDRCHLAVPHSKLVAISSNACECTFNGNESYTDLQSWACSSLMTSLQLLQESLVERIEKQCQTIKCVCLEWMMIEWAWLLFCRLTCSATFATARLEYECAENVYTCNVFKFTMGTFDQFRKYSSGEALQETIEATDGYSSYWLG